MAHSYSFPCTQTHAGERERHTDIFSFSTSFEYKFILFIVWWKSIFGIQFQVKFLGIFYQISSQIWRIHSQSHCYPPANTQCVTKTKFFAFTHATFLSHTFHHWGAADAFFVLQSSFDSTIFFRVLFMLETKTVCYQQSEKRFSSRMIFDSFYKLIVKARQLYELKYAWA